jgi:hypothetical protein
MKIELPFYSNTKDNTHCYQAALRMILKKIYPRKEFSYKKLEKIFDKPKGKWSWPCAALINLKRMGLDVKLITVFDYRKFSKDGNAYLKSYYTKEVADAQIKHSDIKSEMKNAKKMLRYNLYQKKKLTMRNIEKLFKQKWFIIASVNSHTLSEKKGYSGHAVTIIGIDKNHVYLHDPGLPPRPNRKVKKRIFMKALRYPKNESEVFLVRSEVK